MGMCTSIVVGRNRTICMEILKVYCLPSFSPCAQPLDGLEPSLSSKDLALYDAVGNCYQGYIVANHL